MEITIGIVILLITLIIGVPLPFAFGASFIWMAYTLGYQTDFLLSYGYSTVSGFALLAIPFFILAGGIMERGRIGEVLIDFVNKFVGRVRGGLGCVAVVASAVFGSISGSAAATLSCIGSIMDPRLTEAGYEKGYVGALLCNAAPLGLLIPPSSIQILYAWSSNQSVLACFLATLVPGIILATLLCVCNVFLVKKMKIHIAPKESAGQWAKDTGKKTFRAIPALFMPFIILGGIYGGIFTPTEAAAVAVVYAIPVGIYIYKGLTWKGLKEAAIETACTTGVVMVMLFMVMILSRIFTMENVPRTLANALLSISDNKYVILLMINLFMVFVGMLIDDVSGSLLCTPLLTPIVVALGVHPVHFAAILGVNLGMGNVTPPTAPLLYLSGRITGASVDKMLRPTLIMIGCAWLPTLILTTFVPQVALTIPQMALPKIFGL